MVKTLRYFMFIIIMLLWHVDVLSQEKSKVVLDYIEKYKDIAMREMQVYKIPASITLAQGLLESGNGNSELAKKSNNHFGIIEEEIFGDNVISEDKIYQAYDVVFYEIFNIYDCAIVPRY